MFPISAPAIRRRALRRRAIGYAACTATAAVLLYVLAAGDFRNLAVERPTRQEQLASLQSQIEQLQASTDAALKLVHDVLESERKQHRLDKLHVQLASIRDPREQIQKEVDRTAFILVYEADRLYRELGQTNAAVETYNRVIRLFPETQWAEVARQRLSDIENKKYNKVDSEGDSKWRLQNV
jgi:TolA-binding protein